jgi:iron complex outermembrane receptor protein
MPGGHDPARGIHPTSSMTRAILLALLVRAAVASAQTASAQPATPSQQTAPAPPSAQPTEVVLPVLAETVVVTASRIEEKLLNAPAAMTVVGQQQIDTSAATSVADLLQGQAGLNVTRFSTREFGVASRQPVAALGQGQLVLLDGRVVNNGNGGMYWDQLPIDFDELKQVEILHGPASVVWGSNALSAVINLRTKSPRELQGLQLSGGAGERGVAFGGVRWAQAAGKLSYKLSASYYHHDAWARKDTLPDGSPAVGPLAYKNPDLHQPKADARLDYDVDAAHRWSFRLGYGGTSGMLFTNDLPFEFDRSTYMSFGDASYTAPSFEARMYWTRSAGKLRSVLDGSVSPFRADIPTAEIVAHRVVGSKQLLVYGASTRFDFFDVPGLTRNSRHEFGGFVEDQIFLNSRITVNAGLRVDDVQTSGAAVSPRLSVLVKPATEHALRFSVSRAYRAPTPVENFLDLATGYPLTVAPGATVLIPLNVIGNEQLDEVLSLGVEGGYTGVINRRHTLQITAYHVRASDTIQLGTTAVYSPADPPASWPFPPSTVPDGVLPKTSSYRNTGRITNQGVEAALNMSWSSRMWSTVSYGYQNKPRLTGADPAFPVYLNDPPRNQASAIVGGQYKAFRGSLATVFVGRAFWSDVVVSDPRLRGPTPAFTLVNASGAYAVKPGVEFVVKAANIFNRQVQQHAFGDIIGRDVAVYLNVRVMRKP